MNNLKKIESAVKDSEMDALLITGEYNRRYATGFPSSAGVCLVTGDGSWFFTDTRYAEAAGKIIENAMIRTISIEKSYSDRINEVIAERNIKSVGFEQDNMAYSEFKRFEDKLDAELRPAQKLLSDLRMVKSREELQKMIEAQRIAEKSFLDILPSISTDMTEKELAAKLICSFLNNGADDKSFDPIVVSGVRSSMPHGVPTNEKISKGFLTLDFGVILDGWCSDTTRTICIGEPTAEMRRIYDVVRNAQMRGIETARAGVAGKEIDSAARHVIAEAGYGDYFGHGFGHGLGLEVHEGPTANQSKCDIIPTGAVISAEPGIYLPRQFGVRIEDVLYITEEGSENITKLGKELIIL